MHRILYLHNSADIYGASRSLMRLTYALDDGRYEVTVGLPHEGPLQEALQNAGIMVLILPQLRIMTRSVFKSVRLLPFLAELPFATARLAKFIRKERFDLVHSNTGVILNGAAAAKMAGARHVWHIRDWFGEFGMLWAPYSKYIINFSDRVICVSKAIASQFPASPRIQVLPNGFPAHEFSIDRNHFRGQFRDRFQLGEELLIGVVGRIKFQRKGQEYFVQAAKLLKDRGISAKYLIVGAAAPGSEDHLSRLQALIAQLNLQRDVICTGEMEDSKPAYAAMDIAVLPSAQPEPFAGVNMEAMAMGLPVVATNIGGSPDQIEDGVTGLLCKPSDPVDLADKLKILCRDAGLRMKMGEAGRRRVFNQFSLDEMVRQIEAIYTEVLA